MQKTGRKKNKKRRRSLSRFVSRIIYQNSDDFSKIERSGSGTALVHIYSSLVINDANAQRHLHRAQHPRLFLSRVRVSGSDLGSIPLCVARQGFCAALAHTPQMMTIIIMTTRVYQGCRSQPGLGGAARRIHQKRAVYARWFFNLTLLLLIVCGHRKLGRSGCHTNFNGLELPGNEKMCGNNRLRLEGEIAKLWCSCVRRGYRDAHRQHTQMLKNNWKFLSGWFCRNCLHFQEQKFKLSKRALKEPTSKGRGIFFKHFCLHILTY